MGMSVRCCWACCACACCVACCRCCCSCCCSVCAPPPLPPGPLCEGGLPPIVALVPGTAMLLKSKLLIDGLLAPAMDKDRLLVSCRIVLRCIRNILYIYCISILTDVYNYNMNQGIFNFARVTFIITIFDRRSCIRRHL